MDEYIFVKSTDKEYIDEIYGILFKCGWNMARKMLFHWIKPYSKTCIKEDCKTKLVVLARDSVSGEFNSTFQMFLNDEGNLYVRKIATLPSYEGKGIGKKNMQYIEDYARKKGCHKICLDVYKKSMRAVEFYKRNGFVITGETKARFFSEFIMEKSI